MIRQTVEPLHWRLPAMPRFRLMSLLALCCLSLAWVGHAHAATRGIVIEPGSGTQTNRLALVIGNDYDGESGQLLNPVHDADDMRKTLSKLGFEVMGDNQQSLQDMNTLVREFGDRLRPGMVGLFYFAGHGMQINGQNYLMPVQSGIQREDEVPFRALAVDQVLAKMSKNKTGLNLMMLDACRDNPFSRSFRSTTTGLAKMEAPSGTLISYAAKPGTRSKDGDGRNGLYTSVLLKYLPIPGMPIEQMLKKVGSEVRQRSGDQQQTWMEGLLDSGDGGDFCFAGCGGRANTPTTPPYRPVTPTPKPAPAQRPIPQRHSMAPRPSLVAPAVTPAKVCEDCPEMVRLPGGTFMMGSAVSHWNERQHQVTVEGFAIGKYEVTKAEWRRVMGSNPPPYDVDCDRCPVVYVSWNDVQDYLRKLNTLSGQHYRLPTEAEWEYACRAQGSEIYCGADSPDPVAWYRGNSDSKTHPVGQKRANRFGLHDMSGNVWEWTCSTYAGEEYWDLNETKCSLGTRKVTRGGSYADEPGMVRSAVRVIYKLEDGFDWQGFRLAHD